MKNHALVVLLAGGLACAAVLSGCHAKPAPTTAAPPQSVEAEKAQARDKQVQQYILKRRAAARKASKTHSVH